MKNFLFSFLLACCVLFGLGCAGGNPVLGTDGGDGWGDGSPADREETEDGADGLPPKNLSPPQIEIIAPTSGSILDQPLMQVHGTARDDSGLASVFVRVGPNTPKLAVSDDVFRTWRMEAESPVGSFTVEATAYDVDGKQSTAFVRLTRPTAASDDATPVVEITSPADGSTPLGTLALVEGTAWDDRAVIQMETYRNEELLTDRRVDTEDFYQHWVRPVVLLPGQDNLLRFVACDQAQHCGEHSIVLKAPLVADHALPQVAIVSPSPNDRLELDVLQAEGTAFDDSGVREVKVRTGVRDSLNQDMQWAPCVQAESEDGFAHWRASVAAPKGSFVLHARAIDANGISNWTEIPLQNDSESQWSQETAIALRLREASTPPMLRFELDRDLLNTFVNPATQQQIGLLELDPTPLMTSSLNQIKDACGQQWRQDDPDPRHDCSLTALGQTFVGPDGTWRSSPEYALVRLLTMTPANIVVEGTSVQGLQDIADGAIMGIVIGGGFNQIVSEFLGIARTSEIIPTAAAADALRNRWLASHPAVLADGRIPITLYDVMNDLQPLSDRLGASGGHPGIVDPAQPLQGRILGEDFEIVVVAQSNLRWMDGVDLSIGKEYLAVIADTIGPTYNDVLEYDYNDPNRFAAYGIVDNPVVDMRIRLMEDPGFVHSCTEDPICLNNLPQTPQPSPVGLDPTLFATPRWELEHIIGYAAYQSYNTRTFYKCYIDLGIMGCYTSVSIGQNQTPPGWTDFFVFLDIGNPPQDQYAWELISEIAQVALHRVQDMVLPEGEANAAFTVRGIPIGMSTQEMLQAVRPHLESQASMISERLMGDYSRNNGEVDFFYRLGPSDGLPYLWFVAPEDPLPKPYRYQRPGFFADASLGTKLSDLFPSSGDASHEKLKLAPGQTMEVYLHDDNEAVYRVRVFVPSDSIQEVTARVSRRLP